MRNYEIIQEFEGKNVEVTTVVKGFRGILKFEYPEHTLILTPVDSYDIKRFGFVVIDQDYVVAIREILPQPPRSVNNCEDDCDESKG